MRGRFLLAGVAILALTGCDTRGSSSYSGPLLHVSKAIELDKAEMVRVEMRMGAGELNVEGGSPRLLDADFSFSTPEQEPIVRYEDGSFRGRLTIAEPSVHRFGSLSSSLGFTQSCFGERQLCETCHDYRRVFGSCNGFIGQMRRNEE